MTDDSLRQSQEDRAIGAMRGDARFQPADRVQPFRRDQHLMTHPPIAGIDDDVADRPRRVIDDDSVDVTDVAVFGMDIIPRRLRVGTLKSCGAIVP